MSLSSALNAPPLIASLGIATSLYGPTLIDKIPLYVNYLDYRFINVLAYVLNFIAVSIPGRIDGEVAREMAADDADADTDNKKSKRKTQQQQQARAMTPGRGRTLVAPAGWAFAIWGPIFAGELVFIIAQFFAKEGSSLSKTIKEVSNPFVVAQLFQILWCASFRPKYTGNLMWISTGMLGGIAFSLSKAQIVFASTSARGSYTFLQYLVHFFPMALHFGWTTAATLVNLNGAIAVNDSLSNKAVAVAGHISIVAATCLSVGVTVTRMSPVYGGVISWALFAIADGMRKRLQTHTNSNDKGGNLEGARLQFQLSTVGAYLSAATSVFIQALSKPNFYIAP